MVNGIWEACDTPNVWRHESAVSGPEVVIMGGVHGDEGTGPLLVDHLLQNPPHVEEGTLTLILANPAACAEGTHYIGSNMNRGFTRKPNRDTKSPEAERLVEIKPYLLSAVALLDVHDTSSPCDPFLICERNALETARRIGRHAAGNGMPVAFGFSAMEPGGSDDLMFRQGKEGVCYESGDMSNPAKNLPGALEVASRFLIVQGLMEGNVPLPPEDPLLVEVYKSIMTTEDFEWAEFFRNFQVLEEGQLLATSNGEPIIAAAGDVMFFPTRKIVPGDEACAIARTVLAT